MTFVGRVHNDNTEFGRNFCTRLHSRLYSINSQPAFACWDRRAFSPEKSDIIYLNYYSWVIPAVPSRAGMPYPEMQPSVASALTRPFAACIVDDAWNHQWLNLPMTVWVYRRYDVFQRNVIVRRMARYIHIRACGTTNTKSCSAKDISHLCLIFVS